MHNVAHKLSPLQQQQHDFAARIRDPDNSPDIANVTAERMALYRDLFYNNIEETLSFAFPALRECLEDDVWQHLCRGFFRDYRCSTPFLSRVPREFIRYLEQRQVNNPPWLLELAHWQWTELDLFLAADPVHPDIESDDVINGIPVVSSLIRLHQFYFPVHRLNRENLTQAQDQDPYFLLAWRDAHDNIGQMEINALSATLLERLQNNRHQTGKQILESMAADLPRIEPTLIHNGGAEILQAFLHRHIVLGSRLPLTREQHP